MDEKNMRYRMKRTRETPADIQNDSRALDRYKQGSQGELRTLLVKQGDVTVAIT